MRLILAGLFLLTLPTLVFAQATGQVQSIGFDGLYRPNCWTPMLVRLMPQTTDSANYEIEVWQHDLDGDRPIYTRQIVLNGSDQAASQTFWVYFLPQPIEKGLPDQSNGTLHDLQRDLQVFLCTPAHKQIVQLPLTSTLQNVDPYRDSYLTNSKGSKLILAVSANGSTQKQPTLDSYHKAVGEMEDVQVVAVHMNELPEDPIGYESVDSIIWLDGNPADLAGGNLDTLAALKDYIRFGGHLIVSQSTSNWQDDLGFGDLLPVDVQGIASKNDFEPLKSMAHRRGHLDDLQPTDTLWAHGKGPYLMAKATARQGSVVDQWIHWKTDGTETLEDVTPYLARKAYGLGAVTWVAQSLSTETAPPSSVAWPYIWDQVMGLKSDALVPPDKLAPDDENLTPLTAPYAAAGPTDLGYTLVQGLNLNSKANWMILLAILFFVVYWIVAGPGTYAYLVTKKRQGLSWFFFGISALVATVFTVLVVKIVLRGPPEIKHLSFVRIAPNQPAIVYSRFGLYIPRDGQQKLELQDPAASSVSYLSPFAEHPQQLGPDVTEFPSPAEYYVPVRDLKSDSLPQINVDYRSSMKKFQARWVGEWTDRFTAKVKLDPDDPHLPLTGTIFNGSGLDLSDVYLAFNAGGDRDWMIYVPTWPKDTSYDIKRDFAKPMLVGKEGPGEAVPGDKKILSDAIAGDSKLHGWMGYWYSHFHRNASAGDDPNISDSEFDFVYPMLSVFDRLPAMPKTPTNNPNQPNDDRVEFYNRGARILNASPSINTGQLVVLATAKGPLPLPLQVDDDKMTGDGTVFYQFILPIDRGTMDQPTTKPVGNAE
jgi:hypothetical protein